MIQSFAHDEVTPEQAMQIGEELCDKFLQGNYQYVIAVHNDKEHLHCHIIFNNTNLYNGLSFTTEHNQGKKTERAWAELRQISDEICKEHGISVIEPKGKGVSHFERDIQKQGKSWKDKLRVKIAEVAFYSKDFSDFLRRCTECGIEYVYKPQNKVKLKFRLSGEGQQKFTRADTLGDEYTAEKLAESIQQIQKAQAIMEKLSEKKKPEKSAPVIEPKTEPQPTRTITIPTKPTAAPPTTVSNEPESNLSVMTEEEYIKILQEQDRQKQSEKEKAVTLPVDPWDSIRGMRDADRIIADLKSVGITSYSEFSGFMFNTKHPDDHKDELAKLKKKYTDIDTLIAKMKHRDEIAPTYREYKSKSGWAQSRFKKKNAAVIEDYDETVRYIKEHRQKYLVDGKPPTIIDLMGKSNDLKSKWNTLNAEHTAFIAKHDTALKYTRQVRQYINDKIMEREREISRQRTQAKHRNKNALE